VACCHCLFIVVQKSEMILKIWKKKSNLNLEINSVLKYLKQRNVIKTK